MRRTLIAVLLVLAMLFVSCSAESRKSEETTKPAEPAATSPTARDFLSAYLSGLYSYNIVNELWKETKTEGETALSLDNVNTEVFRNFLTGNLDEETTRYTVTEITSASGTLKSSGEGSFALVFKYTTDTKTGNASDWQTGTERVGYLTGSCKMTWDTTSSNPSQSSSNASLNFNAYTVDALPDISTRTATSYKNTKLYNSANGFTRAELDGVALSDAELKKVSDFIKSLPSE